MKGKVLLEVLLPATQAEYEFRVPFDLTVDEAAGLMARVLAQREPLRYEVTGGVDLMLRGTAPGAGDALNPNETVRALVERGVLSDGCKVALA